MTRDRLKPNRKTEDEIRDYLADHLDLIEPGLTLVEKEKYLPNDKGAAGFVDIFAQAASGQLVVIEIKKTDSAAREAIHELSKYAALLKTERLIKDTEYRLIVLSVSWRELLVPFSEFVNATRYECSGREIVIGPNGLPIGTNSIGVLPPILTRRISPRHFIWEFTQERRARDAIPTIKRYMEEVGLEDFLILLVPLKSPVMGITHLVYFAQQEKSLGDYLSIIERRFSKEAIEEFQAWLDGFPELSDKLGEAADKAWESPDANDPFYAQLKADGSQISHPEKANYWLVPEKATGIEIFRFGRFVDPSLADQTILDELKGTGGGSFYRADAAARISSKPEMDALLATSDDLFFFNPTWRTAIRDLCAYAQGTAASEVRFRAFSNDDVLSTLAGLAIGHAGFVPGFELEVARGSTKEQFVGMIEWNGNAPRPLSEIIEDHFCGDEFGYFMHRHFGSNRGINDDLLPALGLAYVVCRLGPEGDAFKMRIQGNSIVDVRGAATRSLSDFLESNEDFVGELVNLFLAHDQSFHALLERRLDLELKIAEAELAEQAQPPKAGHETYWVGEPEKCDLCGRQFELLRFMVDAHLKKDIGACVCALCFQSEGTGLGVGRGQLYENTPEGWLLVAGGSDTHSE